LELTTQKEGVKEGQRVRKKDRKRDGGKERGGERRIFVNLWTCGLLKGEILMVEGNVVLLSHGQVLYDQLLLNPPRSGRKQG
jgi:hypothetical protein